MGSRKWDVGRLCISNLLLAVASPTTPTPALPRGREVSFDAIEPIGFYCREEVKKLQATGLINYHALRTTHYAPPRFFPG